MGKNVWTVRPAKKRLAGDDADERRCRAGDREQNSNTGDSCTPPMRPDGRQVIFWRRWHFEHADVGTNALVGEQHERNFATIFQTDHILLVVALVDEGDDGALGQIIRHLNYWRNAVQGQHGSVLDAGHAIGDVLPFRMERREAVSRH
ncbi:MAG: hypothetical protein JWO50_123 [Candidatus Kaiserbacteria bacterium]|nr:hypothetical protein [Candidatus Kaiserbacteria bacterium]